MIVTPHHVVLRQIVALREIRHLQRRAVREQRVIALRDAVDGRGRDGREPGIAAHRRAAVAVADDVADADSRQALSAIVLDVRAGAIRRVVVNDAVVDRVPANRIAVNAAAIVAGGIVDNRDIAQRRPIIDDRAAIRCRSVAGEGAVFDDECAAEIAGLTAPPALALLLIKVERLTVKVEDA